MPLRGPDDVSRGRGTALFAGVPANVALNEELIPIGRRSSYVRVIDVSLDGERPPA